MQEIDLAVLVTRLRDAEETRTLPPSTVSDYVLTHIYQPLLQDKPVRFAELDYSAFDDSDLDDLEVYLAQREEANRSLRGLGDALLRAETVACRQRAYC